MHRKKCIRPFVLEHVPRHLGQKQVFYLDLIGIGTGFSLIWNSGKSQGFRLNAKEFMAGNFHFICLETLESSLILNTCVTWNTCETCIIDGYQLNWGMFVMWFKCVKQKGQEILLACKGKSAPPLLCWKVAVRTTTSRIEVGFCVRMYLGWVKRVYYRLPSTNSTVECRFSFD